MEDLLLDEGLPFLQFKYETIKKATENFEEVRRLGEGGFGEVYKVQMLSKFPLELASSI